MLNLVGLEGFVFSYAHSPELARELIYFLYFAFSIFFSLCFSFVVFAESYGLNSLETLTRAYSSSLATLGFKWHVTCAKSDRDSYENELEFCFPFVFSFFAVCL